MPAETHAPSFRGKRSYSRPSAETWAEIVALFDAGGMTLPEIARRYGVSVRAIQMHAKADKPTPPPAAPVPPMPTLARSAGKLTEAAHTAMIEETRTSAYDDAVALQSLIARAVAALAADDKTPATAIIRAADQAAVALARVHGVRRLILAMGKGDGASDAPLPELPIYELSQAEVAAIRDKQAREDDGFSPDDMEADAYQSSDADAEGDDAIEVEGE